MRVFVLAIFDQRNRERENEKERKKKETKKKKKQVSFRMCAVLQPNYDPHSFCVHRVDDYGESCHFGISLLSIKRTCDPLSHTRTHTHTLV